MVKIDPPPRPPAENLEMTGAGGTIFTARTAGAERSGAKLSRSVFPTRLLIDLPNWLGDLVMAFPATNRLVQANLGGRTVLHVRPAAERFVSVVFPNAEVVASPRKQAPIKTFFTVFRRLARFDVAVTLRNASRAKILLRLLSRWSVGTCSQGGRALLSWCYRVDRQLHQAHDADAVLARLGLDGCDPGWKVTLPETLVREGARALKAAGATGSGPWVGLAPGVALGGSAKQWPPHHFGLLAETLRNRGFEPVVVIGPGEEELAAGVVIAAGGVLPVVGADLDVAGVAAVLSHLNAVVGNDSGPAHLAAVLGIPGVVLFGPTNPARTAPLSRTLDVMSLDLECAPCGQLTCPLAHQACMKNIGPDVVASRVERAVADRQADEPTLAIAR